MFVLMLAGQKTICSTQITQQISICFDIHEENTFAISLVAYYMGLPILFKYQFERHCTSVVNLWLCYVCYVAMYC